MTATVALADHHAVTVSKKAGVGSFLVDTKGMTLYYFVGDKKPEDTTGQEVKDVWYVVTP